MTPAHTERWQSIDVSRDSGVVTVTLDRPDRLNALTVEVYTELRDVFLNLSHSADARVVVLAGRGRAFCSGGDVDEIIGALLGHPAEDLLEFTRLTCATTKAIRECPLPVVAAVNGVAAGAGAVLALAADFRIVARSASFLFLFTKVGLSGADMGAAYLLPRLVGVGRATELLLLGDKVGADEAERMGLVTRVVDDDRLSAEVIGLARRLADGPTLAYAHTKRLLAQELDVDLATALELDAATQALLMAGDDHREFYEARREGREPRWRRP